MKKLMIALLIAVLFTLSACNEPLTEVEGYVRVVDDGRFYVHHGEEAVTLEDVEAICGERELVFRGYYTIMTVLEPDYNYNILLPTAKVYGCHDYRWIVA